MARGVWAGGSRARFGSIWPVTFVFRLVCLRRLECISYCVNKMRECPKIKCVIVPYIEYCLGGPRAGGGAPSGGYTTTETCQRINPSNQWVSQHCAVSNDVWDAQGPEFEHVAWTHGRFIRRHEPPGKGAPCGGFTAIEVCQRIVL